MDSMRERGIAGAACNCAKLTGQAPPRLGRRAAGCFFVGEAQVKSNRERENHG
jgi:hypothetical protein